MPTVFNTELAMWSCLILGTVHFGNGQVTIGWIFQAVGFLLLLICLAEGHLARKKEKAIKDLLTKLSKDLLERPQ